MTTTRVQKRENTLFMIKIRSMHKDEFDKRCVCREWVGLSRRKMLTPIQLNSNWLPSIVARLSFYHEDFETLKSPTKNKRRWPWLIVPDMSCSKLRKNRLNSSVFWLREGYKKIRILFFLVNITGQTARCSLNKILHLIAIKGVITPY